MFHPPDCPSSPSSLSSTLSVLSSRWHSPARNEPLRCLPQKFDSHPPAALRFWLYGLLPQLFLRYLCKARWVPFSCSTRVVTPPRRRGPGPELVIPIVLHCGSLSVPSELARNPLHLYMPQASIPPHYHAESSHLTERIDCSKSLYGANVWRTENTKTELSSDDVLVVIVILTSSCYNEAVICR